MIFLSISVVVLKLHTVVILITGVKSGVYVSCPCFSISEVGSYGFCGTRFHKRDVENNMASVK